MKFSNKYIFSGKYSLFLLSAVLFLLSWISGKFYFHPSSVSREVKLLEKNLHARQLDFIQLLEDTAMISKMLANKESLEEFKQLERKDYGIFLFTTDIFGTASMHFWNQQLAVPPPEMQGFPDGEYYLSLPNGYYLGIKKTLPPVAEHGNVIACALVQIYSNFYTESAYLPHQFAYNSAAAKKVKIADKETSFPVKALSGKTLCYLDKITTAAIPYHNRLVNIFNFAGIILLLVFLHLFIESIAAKYGAWKSILFLSVALTGLRLMIYFFPALLHLRQFELFDPSIYGSNPMQRSLGDLLINSFLLCWVVLFAWSELQSRDHNVAIRYSSFSKWLAGILSLGLLLFSTFMLASVIKSLVADSKISFDVTDFFSLNGFTVIGFVVLSLLSITYYYFVQLLFRFILPLFNGGKVWVYIITGAGGLFYLSFLSGYSVVLFYLPVLSWLLVFIFLLLNEHYLFVRFRFSAGNILFWVFFFSVSVSAIMLSEINKAEWEKRKEIAEKIAEISDPSSGRQMNIALAGLDNNFLSENFYRFYDRAGGKKFRDSIITGNYRSYQDKYETKLFVYDSAGIAINNDEAETLNTLNINWSVQSKPTRTPGIYYYETSFAKFTYIVKKEVLTDEGVLLGYLFILANPRKYASEALSPVLFRQLKQPDPENSPMFNIAVYKGSSLVSPAGRYSFPTELGENKMAGVEIEKRIKGNYDELWYRADKNIVVAIARKRDTFIRAITLFSYIFCSFLLLVGLVLLLTSITRVLFRKEKFKSLFQFNIRRQVHATIIFISIFSFLIIGIATITFFIDRYNRNNTDKLRRIMQVMVNDVRKKIADQTVFDDVLKVYDPVYGTGLQKLVNEVADLHDVDVNVYDLGGNLQVSSEANVYAKGIVSRKINPVAYYHLNRLREVQFVQDEEIANLSYLSIYAPVRDEEGQVEAYLNIPYFSSQQELNLEISNFMVAIINLNAFIFLIAGIIALIITNRITRSFSLISAKMKEVNLAKRNDTIVWNRKDEIGELVGEYNKMVAKLEASASALAKSEREGAWREMARQVAHEIKNPLTPMKLSIQHLQRSVDNNLPNVKELTRSMAATLVEQIDHLSKIAADFSQFANIGNMMPEKFDLHEIIHSLRELYRSHPEVDMTWIPAAGKIMMHADKTQMNRLFTNLLANAVEARQGEGGCKVIIREEVQDGSVRISITDNGGGIAPGMRDRIFEPNFTTKSSGTGLGLAMCKGIVEQAKGKIWFETEQGRGTIFHVELPLAG